MRIVWWMFAALIGAALIANLALVSARVSENTEDALRSRTQVASAGLRTQMELIDLRNSPRLLAFSPDLIEATRPPLDPSQPPNRPDERALRAAAAASQPEPDLLVIANAHGAAISRRGKAAVLGEDLARLPLVRVALESGASPQFVSFEGALYRASAAKIPGNAAIVMTGTLVDDRLAAQLKSQLDADLSFFSEGKLLASTLGPDDRAAITAWAARSAGVGFGSLRVVLPVVGTALADQFPLGAPRAATRASIVSLAPTLQAVVSVPAAPYFVWLARYQAIYLAAWAIFLPLAFVAGLLAGGSRRAALPPPREASAPRAPSVKPPAARPRHGRASAGTAGGSSLVGADVEQRAAGDARALSAARGAGLARSRARRGSGSDARAHADDGVSAGHAARYAPAGSRIERCGRGPPARDV